MSGILASAETTVMDQVSTGLVSSLSGIATNMGSFIVSILPVVLGVTGAVVLISFGIKLFRRFAK